MTRDQETFRCLVVVVSIMACSQLGDGSQVLMVTMGGTKSHKIPFLELARGLISRGHNITFLNAFPSDNEINGLEEITPLNFVFYVRNYTNWDLLGVRMSGNDAVPLGDILRYGYYSCEAVLSDSETQHLMNSGRSFDLVIMDGAYPECSVVLAYHFKSPFMLINTVAFYMTSVTYGGSPAPYSVTPFLGRSFIDNMLFFDRVLNSVYQTGMGLIQNVFIRFYLERLMRSFIGPSMPSVFEMMRNVSFILQNGHATVTYPRPYLPNVAEIACIHCKPAKSLPKDLEEFINGSDSGFIYVSMGSSVLTAKMPEMLRLMFMRVFSQLPYRVLWKWEDGEGSIPDLPDNVHLSRWLPQQDILGHRKIRAFVTHGGLLSMFETVYHGVPVVTMPVFCDHDANSAKAELDGYALKIELQDLTSEKLLWAINQVIHDPRYRNAVRARSVLLRDQSEHPLERAIYWTEYVMRHKGAYHLHSPSKDYSIIQYYLIDVICFCLVVGFILMKVLVKTNSIIFKTFLSLISSPQMANEDELVEMKKKVKVSVNLSNEFSSDRNARVSENVKNGIVLRKGTVVSDNVTSKTEKSSANGYGNHASSVKSGYQTFTSTDSITSRLKVLQGPAKSLKIH